MRRLWQGRQTLYRNWSTGEERLGCITVSAGESAFESWLPGALLMGKRKTRSCATVLKSDSSPESSGRTSAASVDKQSHGVDSVRKSAHGGPSTSRVLVVDRHTVLSSSQSNFPPSQFDPSDVASSATRSSQRIRSSNNAVDSNGCLRTSRSAPVSRTGGQGSRHGGGRGHTYFTRSKQAGSVDAQPGPARSGKGRRKPSRKTPISDKTVPGPNTSKTPPTVGQEGGFMELGEGTGAFVGYWKDVFDSPDETMEKLTTEVEWLDKEVVVRGQKKKQPRLIAYMADSEDLTYTYSGLKLWPKEYTPTVQKIKDVLQGGGYGDEKLDFNCVLMNYYRNGEDNVAWHSDNEPLFGPNPTIGSVSFGIRRDFVLRSNVDGAQKYVYKLGAGDILVMKGTVQELYKHCVPKRKSVGVGRINLTFRKIVKMERLRKGEVYPWEHRQLKLKTSGGSPQKTDSDSVN